MISIRDFIEKLKKDGKIKFIKKEVSKNFEAASIISSFDGIPLFFENVNGWKVIANLFSTRDLIANYFGVKKEEIIKLLINAIDHPTEPEVIKKAPCQEIIETNVDLNKLPILFHLPKDGGPYITSGVLIANDPEYGRNCAFHRLMQIDNKRFAVRLLPRHTYKFLEKAGGELDVAIVLGVDLNVLIAGATSVDLGFDELKIANSLKPLNVVKCKKVDIEIPANAEIVLEGRIIKETHSEGPFLDLTETYDIVREQPILEIKAITMRKDAIYHALLPGGLEHKMLMGMPREPTIFREVNKVVECKDVYITPGGCSWLHGVVKIKKKNEDDGKKAIEAAFKGHTSMKHVVIVDDDIDIYNPYSVEWAIATRFQAKNGMIIKQEPGSSLDPSADPKTRETSKLGIDATKPLVAKGKNFEKVEFPKINFEEIN